uniref:Relaxin-3 n=1 Tax=Denticeps clupeoides TaxID=299321 RepID=A0AAY4EA96_9TELE
MWKAVVLTLGLFVALVRTANGTEANPIYGVKLCGREFIRAVIFTCGGSRWRRSVGISGKRASDPFTSHDEDASKSWSLNSDPGPSYKQHPNGASWDRDDQDGDMLNRQARSLMSEEVLEALRSSDRKGRDVVVGLSNACCKWGCSKSEISSLC